ncbi:MAG: hypothetical protein FWG03_04335 [Clostridiales bacterium]|nr:hypothetical protein [Clostridiales bacterium]
METRAEGENSLYQAALDVPVDAFGIPVIEGENSLYQAALDRWGAYAQLDQAIEECSELIKAICKYKRDPHSENAMAGIREEAADVFIMLEQLALITGPFDEEKSKKLEKLRGLLQEGQ